MSTSTPDPSDGLTGQTITLPAGVTVGAPRETTQANANGQVQQGMVIPVNLPNGTTTSLFFTYAQMANPENVRAAIVARVNTITAITG